MTDEQHVIEPHHTPQGEWVCYTCKRLLRGTYLRPVLPWEHRPEKLPASDGTTLPGLGTTE